MTNYKNIIFNIKNILVISLITIILNFVYFSFTNSDKDNLLLRFTKKIVSNNYLSIEPFLNRGTLVESFEFLCEKKNCMPFKEQKLTNRKKFIDDLSKNLTSEKILFVPLSLADTYQLLDLRYYIDLPIYVDTKSLGMAYYAKKEFFEEFKKRFELGFKLEECFGKVKNYTDSRLNYNTRIKEILNISYDCKNQKLFNLINELKKDGVGYIVEHRSFLDISYIIFCDQRGFCLYEL